MPEDLRDLPADCICARSAVSPYEGPSYPDEECPVHGTPEPTLMERFDHVNTLLRMRATAPMPDPTADGELGRLRNRITALEANGSELLARAEQAEAEAERLRKERDEWKRANERNFGRLLDSEAERKG